MSDNERIDVSDARLWQTLGELRQAMRTAQVQREEMMAEIRALRAGQEAQRREHDRLVNRGYGVVLGIGLLAGSAGAAIKSFFTGGG